jgi:hypothetical protein
MTWKFYLIKILTKLFLSIMFRFISLFFNAVKHYSISNKVKIQRVIEFCEKMKILYYKENVFRTFNVSREMSYKILRNDLTRRTHNHFNHVKTRNRKSVISLSKIREMKKVLKKKEMKTRELIWKLFNYEVELNCTNRTIKNVMSKMSYYKCIICRKEWVNEFTAKRRLEWVTVIKKRYSDDDDWFRVRFSDEIHFEYDSQDKIFIIRKFDQRYCQDCIQKIDKVKEKYQKRKHEWTAMSHNFKSNMHLYDVSDNQNDKMNQKIYLKSILKLIVKSWLDRNDDFVLKKDDDSSHDINKNNIVKTWKEKNQLKCYFNCVSSTDLNSIEIFDYHQRITYAKFLHWDEVIIVELIFEKWNTISQNFINRKMIEMSKRLQTIIDEIETMTNFLCNWLNNKWLSAKS